MSNSVDTKHVTVQSLRCKFDVVARIRSDYNRATRWNIANDDLTRVMELLCWLSANPTISFGLQTSCCYVMLPCDLMSEALDWWVVRHDWDLKSKRERVHVSFVVVQAMILCERCTNKQAAGKYKHSSQAVIKVFCVNKTVITFSFFVFVFKGMRGWERMLAVANKKAGTVMKLLNYC